MSTAPGWAGGHTIPNGADYGPLCAGYLRWAAVVLVQTGGDMGTMEAEDGTEGKLLHGGACIQGRD
ncbi:MAG: hypothetical protein ACLSAC_04370 [Enterocloster bolteae]